MMNLFEIALASGIVLPASSEGNGVFIFWLLGPAAGIGYYSMMYLRYRNSDKRHQYERETDSQVLELKTYDQKVSSVKGVRRSQIESANSNNPLLRLGRGTTITVIPKPEPTILPGLQEPSAQSLPSEQQAPGGHQANLAQQAHLDQQLPNEAVSQPPMQHPTLNGAASASMPPTVPQQPPVPPEAPPTPPEAPPTPQPPAPPYA